MSTVQPVSGCNLARQMRQSRQRNRQRIFKEWMWTIFTRKTKQIGVVKHGENKHRKYDERDEAEASRTKQDKPKALHCNLFIIISFESGCCWVFINLSVLSLGDIQLTLLVILHAACNVDSLALGHLLRSFCCHTNKVHHATKTEWIEKEKICFF